LIFIGAIQLGKVSKTKMCKAILKPIGVGWSNLLGGLYLFQEETFKSFWEAMIQTGGAKIQTGGLSPPKPPANYAYAETTTSSDFKNGRLKKYF